MSYRRYTTLPILLDLLHNQRLTIVGCDSWLDINDKHSMSLYKQNGKNIAFLGAYCLTKTRNPTFHHWKIYAEGAGGVCINFHDDKFDKFVSNLDANKFRFGKIRYVDHVGSAENIENLLYNKFGNYDLENLPFIKRTPFSAEREYRIVYSSSDKNESAAQIRFDLNIIKSIILSPFLHESLFPSVKKSIVHMAGKSIPITHSKLTNSAVWKKALNRYSARGELA